MGLTCFVNAFRAIQKTNLIFFGNDCDLIFKFTRRKNILSNLVQLVDFKSELTACLKKQLLQCILAPSDGRSINFKFMLVQTFTVVFQIYFNCFLFLFLTFNKVAATFIMLFCLKKKLISTYNNKCQSFPLKHSNYKQRHRVQEQRT